MPLLCWISCWPDSQDYRRGVRGPGRRPRGHGDLERPARAEPGSVERTAQRKALELSMKRDSRVAEIREEAQGALEDAAYLLSQMPHCRAHQIIVHVTAPHLLGLGANPVVSRRQAGRLIASTQRRLRGRCVVTLQWESNKETPLPGKRSMNLREFLQFIREAA